MSENIFIAFLKYIAYFVQPLFFQASEQEYEKEKLNERIAKLSGGVAVIQVLMLFHVKLPTDATGRNCRKEPGSSLVCISMI